MEAIKTTPNLDFDVIYSDGTRKRVQEGVLYEATEDGDIIFHNGTSKPAVLKAAAETILMSLFAIGPGLEGLVMGMALQPETRVVLRILAEFADKLLKLSDKEKQAIFRLGQMDMRQAAVDALLAAADGTHGVVCSTLIDAAERVRKLEVTE